MDHDIDHHVPARIAAAMAFLSHARWTEEGSECGVGRDLTKKEEATKDAALDLMTLYLRGEVDCGGEPVSATPESEPQRQCGEPYLVLEFDDAT